MRILRSVAEVRTAVRDARAVGDLVGLVPTMGAFFDGHLSLMRRARAESDFVVVSLFVNPMQFSVHEDLGAYPRDEARDADFATMAGADILFSPPIEELYPEGFSTTIHVSGITELLCGVQRGPGHFDGVATVVAKLFQIVAPDTAYFRQKDAQQILVIRRLVRDLDIPVRVVACPIVRKPDGLAMSSGNRYLDAASRSRAAGEPRAGCRRNGVRGGRDEPGRSARCGQEGTQRSRHRARIHRAAIRSQSQRTACGRSGPPSTPSL